MCCAVSDGIVKDWRGQVQGLDGRIDDVKIHWERMTATLGSTDDGSVATADEGAVGEGDLTSGTVEPDCGSVL